MSPHSSLRLSEPKGNLLIDMKMALDATETELSDEQLLVLYSRGDAKAARQLTSRLTPKVLGHAYRMLSDRAEAEDVAQEAMLRLWKIAPQWEAGKAQVSTWLYRVVANLCTDRLRKRGRVTELDENFERADETPGVEEQMTAVTRASALKTALAGLPERQREAIVLRHIEGLQNPEIAVIMDISVEAVESLTARAKRGLKAALMPRKEELGIENG